MLVSSNLAKSYIFDKRELGADLVLIFLAILNWMFLYFCFKIAVECRSFLYEINYPLFF